MTRLLVTVGVMTFGLTVAEAAEPDIGLPIRPPANPNTPIVVLDFDENLSASGAGAAGDLDLAIYADGRAVVTVAGTNRRQVTGTIPSPELHALLHDLVVEHELLNCRTVPLQRSISAARRERQRPEPGADAATTVIRVQTKAGTHEVRCHALGLTASQLPDLTDVRNLFACQQRLENVAAVIRAGGYENVNAVLSAANRQLQQRAPQTELLTSRDLNLVDLRPDGTRYLQFSRVADLDGLRPAGGFVMVSVYQTPGRPPKITVTADAS